MGELSREYLDASSKNREQKQHPLLWNQSPDGFPFVYMARLLILSSQKNASFRFPFWKPLHVYVRKQAIGMLPISWIDFSGRTDINTIKALRANLGLRNSSNPVEKANDLVVAGRQKHNGMAWSGLQRKRSTCRFADDLPEQPAWSMVSQKRTVSVLTFIWKYKRSSITQACKSYSISNTDCRIKTDSSLVCVRFFYDVFHLQNHHLKSFFTSVTNNPIFHIPTAQVETFYYH